VYRQQQKPMKDWVIVSRNFPDKAVIDYTYYWLMVNTRSLYYEVPSVSALLPREDRMVLCPFIDFFNHADHGVRSKVLQRTTIIIE